MYNQNRSKDKTFSKIHRIFNSSIFFCSIDKKVNVFELDREFNTIIKRDSLTNVCISSSSKENENLIDCLFS